MAINEAPRPTLLNRPPLRQLSDRAKARLRIAAVLLGRRGLSPEPCGEDFCAHVLQVIESLDPQSRSKLRECVDWVEAYERTEVHRPRR